MCDTVSLLVTKQEAELDSSWYSWTFAQSKVSILDERDTEMLQLR